MAAAGGWIYWQQHKKSIIKDQITKAISNKTDNVYFIRYDSSSIDEVNGNASFYNVVLQSDSLQRQLLQFDTASSATIFNIRIDEVTVRGADIPGLLSNSVVNARSIRLIHPVVYIISSGKKKKSLLIARIHWPSMKKLLGNFNKIHAGEILIENGQLNLADKTGLPHTVFNQISINLKDFKIDKTRNYQNIVSYFIKDVVAKVKEVTMNRDSNQTRFTDVEYNAPGRFITLKKFQQLNNRNQVIFDVNNTAIRNIYTDSFILRQLLKADELSSDGGMLTFYRKKKENKENVEMNNDEIEIDNNYFDEALLDKINIGSTTIYIHDRAKPNDSALTIRNVRFNAKDIQKLYSGTRIRNVVSSSSWALSADGFSFMSENKRYRMNVGAFDINSINSSMRISSFSLIPQLTEAAFSRSIRFQEDLYKFTFKNIELTGINTSMLIMQKRLEAATATVQLDIRAFNDRTVTPNPASKVGKYPHQLLQKLKFPLSIKKLIIKNGYVAYKERGAISQETGVVFFKNINGTITNLTNIKDLISQNNMLVLNARALFMGVSDLQTTWKLPLNTTNGAFNISGTGGGFNAEALNPIIEPLGMASVRKGRVDKVTFDFDGTDHMAKGTSTLLYNNLKIDLLKKDSADADSKKKKLASFVGNILIKDENPKNGEVRKNEITQERDITKSFFYLAWKSIFNAAKKTVSGKSTEEGVPAK